MMQSSRTSWDSPVNANPWTPELFHAAFASAPTAVGLLAAEGGLRRVNSAFGQLLGRPAGELEGCRIQELLRPGVADHDLDQLLSSSDVWSNKRYPFLHSSGTVVWGLVHCVHYVSVIQGANALVQIFDVTEQELIERRLLDKERRYELATRAGRTGFWEWDAETDSTYADSIVKEFIGYSDEFGDQGEDWNSRIHPDDFDRLMAMRQELLEGRTPVFQGEFRFLHRDGSVRWLLIRGTLQRDQQGRPHRMVGTTTDVTERRALERELLEITARAQRRIGEALHDQLGQELTGLAFLAQNLCDQLTGELHPASSGISRICDGLSQSLRHVRLLARGLMPVQIYQEGLMDALSELVDRTCGLDVDCVFRCGEPVFVANREVATQVYHIAQEAVANAIRHASASRILVTLHCDEGVLSVVVDDDGGGTQPFDPERGMGLRIMRHRASLIGGRLEIGAGPTGGTRVTCSVRGDWKHGQILNPGAAPNPGS